MKKYVLYLAIIILTASGCVSKTVHEKTLGDLKVSNVEINNLQNSLKECVRTTEELKRDLDLLNQAMTGEVSSMRERLDELKNERDDYRTKNDFLNRENNRLMQKAGELTAEKEAELAKIKETYENLVGEMKGEIESGQIKITQAMDKLSVNFVEKILFDSGRAEIKPTGMAILKRVGEILKKVTDKQISVEGHTDNVPIGPKLQETFATNWELSAVRATTVVRFLDSEVGLAPAHMSAVGYSHYKPVADNDVESGRAENRRIEIVLLPMDPGSVLQELKGEEEKKKKIDSENSAEEPVTGEPMTSEPMIGEPVAGEPATGETMPNP